MTFRFDVNYKIKSRYLCMREHNQAAIVIIGVCLCVNLIHHTVTEIIDLG